MMDRWWSIRQGLRNVGTFRKVVWEFNDAQFEPAIAILGVCAKEVADHLTRHDMHSRSAKSARELRIVANICYRLSNDEVYYVKSSAFPNNKHWFAKVNAQQKQEVELLCKLLTRFQYWWC